MRLVLRIFEQARDRGQIDDLFRIHCHRDCRAASSALTLYGWPSASAPIVEMTGVSPSSSKRWISSARTLGDVADEAERRVGRGDRQQPRVLARYADRDRLLARLAVDDRDEVAVDLSDQHHADDLKSLRIGDAKAVAELRLLPDAAQHRVDLRPAAMNQHAAHADAAQQQHVLRQREVALAVDRRAAELHHH